MKIPTEDGYDNVKVTFLSSGSVTNVNVIVNGTAVGAVVKEVMGIRQLSYGGFLTLEVNVANYSGSPYEVSVRNVDGAIVQTLSCVSLVILQYSRITLFGQLVVVRQT